MAKLDIKKSLSKEGNNFKEFAFKGNIFDLAVGVIIGTAFSKVISSLVDNIFMPPIGYLTSKVDFSKLYFALGSKKYDSLDAALEANAVVIKYGEVISVLISFLITALVVYIFVVKVSKSLKKEQKEKKEVNTKECPYCKSEIHKDATRCPECTSKV
jgi:large conductance mechanosensitive channel